MKELCEKMKELRNSHDMTQKAVADYLGVSQQQYSCYEQGCCEAPKWAVNGLAELYQVSEDDLLGVDTGYFESVSLMNIFCDDITMNRAKYDIQTVKKNKRQELLNYIRFLNNNDA